MVNDKQTALTVYSALLPEQTKNFSHTSAGRPFRPMWGSVCSTCEQEKANNRQPIVIHQLRQKTLTVYASKKKICLGVPGDVLMLFHTFPKVVATIFFAATSVTAGRFNSTKTIS